MEIELISKSIQEQVNLDALVAQANSFNSVPANDREARNCLSMALQVRKLEKGLEASRIELTKPHVDYQRSINKIVKDFKEKLKSIEDNLHKKVAAWIESEKDNPFNHVETIEVEDGSIYKKDSYDFSVKSLPEIPLEFMCVNEKAVETAISNGIRNIPGLEITRKEETVLRVKNI